MSICPAEYWIWLQTALGAGARVDELLAYFGDAEKLYNAGSSEWRLSGLLTARKIEALKSTSPSQTAAVFNECRKKGYTIITPDSEYYPERLRTLADMPLVLYASGDASVLKDTLSIGIVGTREASNYGIETAQKLSYALAKCGVTVISGGALGIDSEAHAGAMLADGRTAAVLGCGLSVDYLKENAALRRAIARHGAVVSEYQPFTGATRTTFPIRNRLISGMTLGIVVVEAGVKSGSLITADRALEQGRDVFAVPGDIVRSSFGGTNHLIKNGAKTVFGAEDILSEYEYRYAELIDFDKLRPLADVPYTDYRHSGKKAAKTEAEKPAEAAQSARSKSGAASPAKQPPARRELGGEVSQEALQVYAVLGAEPTHIDDIVRKTALRMNVVLRSLTELEIAGAVEMISGKNYVIC